MILNGLDLARAEARITMLKGRCDRLRRRVADPKAAALATNEIARTEFRIDELTEQVRVYFALLSESGDNSRPLKLVDVPENLIKRRIRLGWSQAQFAQMLGLSRQLISRYEKSRYASVSLKRLVHVDLVLRTHERRRRLKELRRKYVCQVKKTLA